MKRPKGDIRQEDIYKEVDYLLHLRGVGGAPLALGLCVRLLAQLITFEGPQTLYKYL